MSMKPILFNTEEVRATLDGRKTAKRLVVKPQPNGTFDQHWGGFYKDNEWILLKEPYRPGDILYVRETWFQFKHGGYAYRADSNEVSEMMREDLGYKWRSSTTMPREAARIFLRVTDVRVERLQEITVKSTLVPTTPIITSLYVTGDGSGEMAVVEMVPQIPGQMGMDGGEQDSLKLLKFAGAK